MRNVFALTTVLILATHSVQGDDRRTPVLVELFTSEGCSSCPPAEELLDEMQSRLPNIRVVALEEHVDYWNNLGWTDRFSSPQFRARQNQYARLFETDSIYTPQMVVNGHSGFAGGDMNLAVQEINRAAVPQRFAIRLELQRNPKDSHDAESRLMDLTVYVKSNRPGKPEASDVYLAISENHLSTNVLSGENGGRRLRHGPVVRSFGVIGSIEGRAFNEVGLKSTLKLPGEWRPDHLRAVVFIQDHKTNQITGVAVTSLAHSE